MANIDLNILHFINQFAGENPFFDKAVMFISLNHLFKGGIFVLVIWFLWFKKGKKKLYRPIILINILGCFLVMFLARILARILPYRLRPLHDDSIELSLPVNFNESYAEGLSSFPSDHAALFFALATGIYFLNKKYGIIALLYSLLIICLPRIYLGLHFPSDIIGGATLGIVIIIAINKIQFFQRLADPLLKFKKAYPGIFYALFFLITYQIADMFESARAIIKFFYFLLVGEAVDL